MGKRPETLEEWQERYQKKADTAFDNYQWTGDGKYERQYSEYEMIASCIQTTINARDLMKQERAKRARNCEWQCDKLIKAEYSRSEVIKMLHDAIYW